MKDYYCFDIAFPNIVFDEFMSNSEKVKSIHHAHIYSKENEIEVRILFESNTAKKEGFNFIYFIISAFSE